MAFSPFSIPFSSYIVYFVFTMHARLLQLCMLMLYASYAQKNKKIYSFFATMFVIEECGISFNVSTTVICVLSLLHSVYE